MTAPSAAPPLLPLPIRIGVGLLSGVGATGIAAGLGYIGRHLDIDVPLVDVGSLILIAPLVAIPFVAGAALRGAATVIATVGAAAAVTIAAGFAIDNCGESTIWVAMGLLIVGFFFVPIITGFSAVVGTIAGASGRFERNRIRCAWALVGCAAIGVVGWVAFLGQIPRCS
jgi:hypothetical protein